VLTGSKARKEERSEKGLQKSKTKPDAEQARTNIPMPGDLLGPKIWGRKKMARDEEKLKKEYELN